MRRASILLISLWALCLLTFFAVYLGFAVRQKITLTQRLSSRNVFHYVGQAAVKRSIIELNKGDPAGPDSLKESWSNNRGAFCDVKIGGAKYSVSYDYTDYFSGSKITMYGVVDEESKINVNKSGLETLKRLFADLGFESMQAQELAASIIDFRDNDSLLSIPLGSAEDSYYRWLAEPYQAKNADFESMQELLLVKGVTPEAFEKIKDFITIFGEGKININTAPHQVLAGLGLSKTLVSKIMTFRYGIDQLQGTNDDGVFSSPETAAAQLNSAAQLSDTELTEFSNLAASGSVVTSSSNFMINSAVGPDNAVQGPQQSVICVVTRQGKILSYAEF